MVLAVLVGLAASAITRQRTADARVEAVRNTLPTDLDLTALLPTDPDAPATRWRIASTRTWTGSDRPLTDCVSDDGTEVLARRDLDLERVGGGSDDDGWASFEVRRFPTSAQAAAFVSAHQGEDFRACDEAVRLRRAADAGWVLADVVAAPAEPIAGGTAMEVASIRDGSCVIVEHEYWQAVDRYALTAVVSTCGVSFDPSAEAGTVDATIERLRSLAAED